LETDKKCGKALPSSDMDGPLLSADGLEFAYGRKTVLRDLNLRVEAGEIVLLLGLNGAGKSTALSLLAGERPPRGGQVRVLGLDPRRALARRRLWLLKEVASPASHLSGAESVRFYLDLYARSGARGPVIDRCLARVGLAGAARQRARTYSKGMARRLELACLLATDPDVWLLDEPQSGLDPRGMRLLREILLEARDRGRGLVVASHALSDVPTLADRVLVLGQGETTFLGTREELMEKVGARGFVAHSRGAAFDNALAELAREHGVALDGPVVPSGPLEELLFREDDGGTP